MKTNIKQILEDKKLLRDLFLESKPKIVRRVLQGETPNRMRGVIKR
jgi:hypothetical protein